jgi:hypothetical protein
MTKNDWYKNQIGLLPDQVLNVIVGALFFVELCPDCTASATEIRIKRVVFAFRFLLFLLEFNRKRYVLKKSAQVTVTSRSLESVLRYGILYMRQGQGHHGSRGRLGWALPSFGSWHGLQIEQCLI